MRDSEPMLNIGRIIGIVAVFLVACVGWAILGGVTAHRTATQTEQLGSQVESLWGVPQTQRAPKLTERWRVARQVDRQETEGVGRNARVRHIVETAWDPFEKALQPESTKADAAVHLDQRLKGLMWYSLYDVVFDARWQYRYEPQPGGKVEIELTLPEATGVYDDFRFVVNGRDVAQELRPQDGKITYQLDTKVDTKLDAQNLTLAVHYKTRGKDSWFYDPGEGVSQLRDFHLGVTCDFNAIDYPQASLSPSSRTPTAHGWALAWDFRQVLSGRTMGLVMPERIQPGDLTVALITTAPVSLLLFFVLLMALSILQRLDIHPINYLALAAAFFSFHLLFAYAADHVHVGAAFLLASGTSIVMVTTYMRLVVSARFAFREVALAQLVYQVGFSLAHFQKGSTGLTISVLVTATLFVLMQLTGRLRWSSLLQRRAPEPAR